MVPSRLQYLVPELQAVVAFCDDSSIYMSSYYIDNSGTAIACGSCLVGDARSELNLHPQPNTLNLQHPQHLPITTRQDLHNPKALKDVLSSSNSRTRATCHSQNQLITKIYLVSKLLLTQFKTNRLLTKLPVVGVVHLL